MCYCKTAGRDSAIGNRVKLSYGRDNPTVSEVKFFFHLNPWHEMEVDNSTQRLITTQSCLIINTYNSFFTLIFNETSF